MEGDIKRGQLLIDEKGLSKFIFIPSEPKNCGSCGEKLSDYGFVCGICKKVFCYDCIFEGTTKSFRACKCGSIIYKALLEGGK